MDKKRNRPTRSERFLQEVSKSAEKSGKPSFDRIKEFLFGQKNENKPTMAPNKDEDAEKKRKELIERERQRSLQEIKPRKY